MTETEASDHREANRRAALRWGGFVVALLSLQVIGGIAAIMIATGDESFAVVPNYHQKALHWDDEVQAPRGLETFGLDGTNDSGSRLAPDGRTEDSDP